MDVSMLYLFLSIRIGGGGSDGSRSLGLVYLRVRRIGRLPMLYTSARVHMGLEEREADERVMIAIPFGGRACT
jgi:hypothetical protein